MKVITKCVSIENKEFVLIQMEEKDIQNINENNRFIIGEYGTIDYELLDEKGCLKRAVNGIEMLLSKTISGAIETRKDQIYLSQYDDMDDNERMKVVADYFKRKYRMA